MTSASKRDRRPIRWSYPCGQYPHLVGPGTGGCASLFAAAVSPWRFRSLIIGSCGATYPMPLGGLFKECIEVPDLDTYRRADPRRIVADALSGLERQELWDFIREDYLSSYDGDRFVESMHYVRSFPTELPVLRDLLPTIETPVQIIAGTHDALVPLVNAEFVDARLPNSKLAIIDAGHFTWEDAPDEYAALTIGWWNGGYASTTTSATTR
jgi:pimeloyl-ACP methyl ester carboxylesterase